MLDKLTRRGALTETDVGRSMREVRRALLEADVALEVVKEFTNKVKAKAIGQEVVKSITPGQMVVKIVHDDSSPCLGARASRSTSMHAPVPILMVGLQGSGKTTTTAKIAYRLTTRDRKKVLMASLDTRRPAAQEQLRVLGEQTDVDTLPVSPARRRSRSRGAPWMPAASVATTWCCSTPPAASPSTSSRWRRPPR